MSRLLGSGARPTTSAEAKVGGNVRSGIVVAGHGRCRGPSEVVVQHLPDLWVLVESNSCQGLIETGDGTAIHLVVLPVAAVHPHDRAFIAKGVGVRGRAALHHCTMAESDLLLGSEGR